MVEVLSNPGVERVRAALAAAGVAARIVELPGAARTAKDAARYLGCDIGQIAKSLVFRGRVSRNPILVITSGANRVNEAALAQRIGEPIERADADFVREATGFAIGGVPPLCHSSRLATYFDEDLLPYPTIWAAAGTPHALFEIDPAELMRVCEATAVSVKGQ